MMRKIAALLVLGAFAVPAHAGPDVQYGVMTLAFGKAKRADGTIVDLTGMKLPVKVERIKAAKGLRPPGLFNTAPAPFFGPPSNMSSAAHPAPAPLALQTFYWADQDPNNTGALPYGLIDPEFESCSVLDDITVNANAIGKVWSQMTWGMDVGNLNTHLIRWTLFTTYNSSAPNGTSAFGPWPILPTYLLDFGAKWPPTGMQPEVGTFKITAGGFQIAQVSAPQTSFWMCQQLRQWQGGNPDAPFDTEMRCAFNQSLPPQLGASDIYYWLDREGSGPDGMYEEQEKDIFGETQNPMQGNLLLRMEGNSTSTVVDALPTNAVLEKGVFVSGDFSDLHFSDNFYYIARPDYTLPRNVEPIQLRIDGRAPQSNINSISFSVESSTVGGDGIQKLQLYRFGGLTPGWVDVNTRTITGIDSTYTYVYTGANPEYFVNPADQNRVRARVLVTPGPGAARSFVARVDRGKWSLGIP